MEERSFYYRYCIEIPEKYFKISEYFESILKENDFDVQSLTHKKSVIFALARKMSKKC